MNRLCAPHTHPTRYPERVGLPSPRLLASAVVIAGALVSGPPAQAARTASPTLVVNFAPTGAVSVTLPSGTPVGTTSGAPTTISPGSYTLVLNGPGNCTPEPLFELKGPGVDLTSDMLGSEVSTYEAYATFQPNATYTWHTDWNQSVVYAFTASGPAAAATPSVASTPSSAGASSTPSSQDIVGSDIVPFRGKLAVAVSTAGKLTVTFGGRSATNLKAGRYTLAVTDRSSTSGFVLQHTNHKAITVAGKAFVGTRTISVDLTAGRWLFMPSVGKTALTAVVS